MTHPCTKEDAINDIKEDVTEIKADVKLLIKDSIVRKTRKKLFKGLAGVAISLLGIFLAYKGVTQW